MVISLKITLILVIVILDIVIENLTSVEKGKFKMKCSTITHKYNLLFYPKRRGKTIVKAELKQRLPYLYLMKVNLLSNLPDTLGPQCSRCSTCASFNVVCGMLNYFKWYYGMSNRNKKT